MKKSLKPQEAFDYIDDMYKFIAMSFYRDWCPYEEKPMMFFGRFWEIECPQYGDEETERFIINIDYDGEWEDSLFVRKNEKD